MKAQSAAIAAVCAVWAVAACVGARKPGLNQQVTKESQNVRGGVWPPPAVFDMPEPVDLLTAALEFVHKDKLDEALEVLLKAAAAAPESYEVAMHLGFVCCALGKQHQAQQHLRRALPPEAPSPHSALAVVDGPYEAGDTVLEAAVREALSKGQACVPLPLLYPSELVVEETSAEVGQVGEEGEEEQHTRVYFLDRIDGEGSMVVKQTSTLAAAREAFVLLELRYSSGAHDDGAPPSFPTVFGSLVTQV